MTEEEIRADERQRCATIARDYFYRLSTYEEMQVCPRIAEAIEAA